MDLLTAAFLDLLYELRDARDPIVLGGGFGLYLKRQHLERTGQQTLLDQLPDPRATNDLDIFIRTEVLVDHGRTERIHTAIVRLGYVPVPAAKFMQWVKEVLVNETPQSLKIDLLVGPLGTREADLDADDRRARPKRRIQLHARRTEEAVHIEDEPIAVTLSGKRSNGEPYAAPVYIPQAFPYLMMKLHAFDDQKDRANKDLGRHHALDLYGIVGMMTEEEYDRAKELGSAEAADERVRRGRAIVRDHFGSRTALGTLRLREHPLFRDVFQVDEFLDVLAEIFPGR